MAKKSQALTPRGRPSRAAVKGLATLPAVAAAIDQLESTIGGRDRLVSLMGRAPLDEDLAYVLGAIADPRQDTRRLSTICAQMGISLFDVYQGLKEGVFAEAVLKSMLIVAEKTPGVVDALMTRAAPHTLQCEPCRGVGTVTSSATPDAAPTICVTCKGTGVTGTIYPSVEQQKLALSIGPLAPKPPAQIDARSVTQIAVHDHSAAGFAKLIALTDHAINGPLTIEAAAETIEAEVPHAD